MERDNVVYVVTETIDGDREGTRVVGVAATREKGKEILDTVFTVAVLKYREGSVSVVEVEDSVKLTGHKSVDGVVNTDIIWFQLSERSVL